MSALIVLNNEHGVKYSIACTVRITVTNCSCWRYSVHHLLTTYSTSVRFLLNDYQQSRLVGLSWLGLISPRDPLLRERYLTIAYSHLRLKVRGKQENSQYYLYLVWHLKWNGSLLTTGAFYSGSYYSHLTINCVWTLVSDDGPQSSYHVVNGFSETRWRQWG